MYVRLSDVNTYISTLNLIPYISKSQHILGMNQSCNSYHCNRYYSSVQHQLCIGGVWELHPAPQVHKLLTSIGGDE